MADEYLPTQYQQYIHLSRYSRWDYEKERSETWEETVHRYFTFFKEHLENNYNFQITPKIFKELKIFKMNI